MAQESPQTRPAYLKQSVYTSLEKHSSPRRGHYGWWLAVLVTSSLLLAVFLPPLVGEPLRSFVMAGFSAVCHQIVDRTFHLHGAPMAVCHRCTGIYAGLWIGVMTFPFWGWRFRDPGRYGGILLVAALAPAGADWLAEIFGLWNNTVYSRVVTGFVFGLIAGYMAARALSENGKIRPGRRTVLRPQELSIEEGTE